MVWEERDCRIETLIYDRIKTQNYSRKKHCSDSNTDRQGSRHDIRVERNCYSLIAHSPTRFIKICHIPENIATYRVSQSTST